MRAIQNQFYFFSFSLFVGFRGVAGVVLIVKNKKIHWGIIANNQAIAVSSSVHNLF